MQRRLRRGDKLAPWMICLPELTMVSLAGAAHVALPALVCEAAAALIGNCVPALMREPEQERCGPRGADALVHAVGRFDPPVQNVRRVVMRDCGIGGARLTVGQEVLLVLAKNPPQPDWLQTLTWTHRDSPSLRMPLFSHAV